MINDVESINDLQKEDLVRAVEERAAQIMSEINAATSADDIRAAGDRAQALELQIPPGTEGASTARMRIDEAVAAAQQRALEAESMEENTGLETIGAGFGGFASSKVQNFIRDKFMSKDEKEFMNKLDEKPEFATAKIDENGNPVETGETVSSKKLKEDFTRVKFNALSDSEQKEVLESQAFRENPDQSLMDKSPEGRFRNVEQLKESLERLKGARLKQLMDDGASPEECRECNRKFMKAETQASSLQDSLRSASEAKSANEAQTYTNMADVKEKILKDTLQKDVIEDAVLDKGQSSSEMKISGGQNVNNGKSAQLSAAIAGIGDNLRNSGMSIG